MTATQLQAVQKLTSCAICNAESTIDLQPLGNDLYPFQVVHLIIGKERAKVLELRTKMGLHRLETDRTRWERWEITCAKLMALDAVRDSLLAMEDAGEKHPGDLTGEKSILLFVQEKLTHHRQESVLFMEDGVPTAARWHDAKAEAFAYILSKFSGSAGTQPLTSEEMPEPMGNPPVTVPASNLAANIGEWVGSLTTPQLQGLSEELLDELEVRGAVVHWSLTGA